MAQSMVKGYIYSINRCIYIMLALIGVLRHFSMFSAVLNQLKTFCLVVAAVTASQHEYQDHKRTQLHGQQMHLIICTCAFPITCKNVSREKQRCRSKHTGMMEKMLWHCLNQSNSLMCCRGLIYKMDFRSVLILGMTYAENHV